MTNAQIRKFVGAIDNRVGEFFDGYVLVGFKGGTQEPIIIRRIPDQKSALALQSLLGRVDTQELPPDESATAE